MTIGQKIMKEIKNKPQTISQLSNNLGIEEPNIRTTIKRLKDKGLIEETGMFVDRYKIYRISDKISNISLTLNMLMKINGVKAVALINVEGIPVSSVLPEGVKDIRVAAMTTALVSLGIRACKDTKKGDLNIIFIQGEEGSLLVVKCGPEHVLTMSLDKTISIELLFNQLFKIIDLIRSTIIDLSTI